MSAIFVGINLSQVEFKFDQASPNPTLRLAKPN